MTFKRLDLPKKLKDLHIYVMSYGNTVVVVRCCLLVVVNVCLSAQCHRASAVACAVFDASEAA